MNGLGRVVVTLLAAAFLVGVFSAPGGAHFRPATPSVEVAGPPRTGGPTWPALEVTALGDSVTAGTRCDCEPFPELYADARRRNDRVPVEITNDGVAGQTSADVLAELQDDRAVQADVAGANVVVLTIGANDFGPDYGPVTAGRCGEDDALACARPALAALADRLPRILARIDRLRNHQPTAVLVTGYWNVFEDGDVAAASMTPSGLTISDRLTRASNAVTATATTKAHDTYVDLYAPFKGESAEKNPTSLLADDGDHPNAAGHRLIARTLVAAGLAPLTPH
jgi:lysophospholipase L1-like esterase